MNAQANTIRYTHLRKKKMVLVPTTEISVKGGATVAWEYDDEGKRIIYKASLCSERDNFCRKTGRMIAAGRLSKGDSCAISYEEITGTDKSPSYKEVNNYLAGVLNI